MSPIENLYPSMQEFAISTPKSSRKIILRKYIEMNSTTFLFLFPLADWNKISALLVFFCFEKLNIMKI
jgi:hypothetical protein